MPLITICDGCWQEIDSDVQEGRFELEVPSDADMWWASDRLVFHGRACLALWVDRTDPDGAFCPQCAPDALPPGADSPERVSQNHYAVRFATREKIEQHVGSLFGACPPPERIRPFIDGEDASERLIVELMAGDDGWALTEVVGLCPIHHCYRLSVIYGNVSVEPS